MGIVLVGRFFLIPVGQNRHLNVAGQILPRDIFVSQLPRNWVILKEAIDALSCGRETVWEAF